jgi:hypothetical protein
MSGQPTWAFARQGDKNDCSTLTPIPLHLSFGRRIVPSPQLRNRRFSPLNTVRDGVFAADQRMRRRKQSPSARGGGLSVA